MLPIIKSTDVDAIFTTVNSLNPAEKTKEVRQLVSEIQKAKKVSDTAIPRNVIQLGSYFEVKFEKQEQEISMTLVLPKYADLNSSRLSLFSPLSVALIGYKEGDRVEWPLPVGKRIIQILKVKNPEPVPVS